MTVDGPIEMAKVTTDTVALAWTPNEKTLQDNRVLTFLHRDEEELADFVRITAATGDFIELTASHLLLAQKDGQREAKIVEARTLRVGDLIFRRDNTGEVIASMSIVQKRGVYAPLTDSGTLIVNGFRTSCYGNVPSHDLVHTVLLPLRLKERFLWRSSGLVDGIHPYCVFLMKAFPSMVRE